jgi:hypothetical protein
VPFEECLRLLDAGSIGRIAVVMNVDQSPIVVPVNYRLVETSGVRWTRCERGPETFEIDGVDPVRHEGWSVLVRRSDKRNLGPRLGLLPVAVTS